MMKNIVITVLFVIAPLGILRAQTSGSKNIEPEWVRMPTRLGDDVPTYLERYGLYDHACNVEHFLKINGLGENYLLGAGKVYNLPIKLVTYNGKTIRSTLGITSWKVAVRIQQYNESMLAKGLRGTDFRVDKKLWVPWHELNCPGSGEEAEAVEQISDVDSDLTLAETEKIKGSRVFPIFGKKYAKTPLVSNRLKGKVFYVISGHGGPDVGAQGKYGRHTLCEDEYAYDVALRLVRLLVSHSATAYMIVRDENDGIRDLEYLPMDKDEVVWGNRTIPRPHRPRLEQRTDILNELTARNLRAGIKNQTFIEIHVDSRATNAKTDVFFYFRPGSAESEGLARHIHKTFLQKYLKVRGQRGYEGTVTPRGLFMLERTTVPKAVYIELGNIRNSWDQQRLVKPSNRQALANWIGDALLTYKK